MRDSELLALEAQVIWEAAQPAEVEAWPALVIAQACDGQTVVPGPSLARRISIRAQQVAAGTGVMPLTPGGPPRGLDECVHLLGGDGAVTVSHGPSFLVERNCRRPSLAEDVELLCSDGPWPTSLSGLAPELQWHPAEWADLLAGRFGPWAMAVDRNQVVSVCHTARLVGSMVEAGVWTRQDHRGRGLATAVTALWCQLTIAGGLCAFYSTSTENPASQEVARRLGLRPLGSLWQLRTG